MRMLLLVLLLLQGTYLQAQKDTYVGLFSGLSYYQGDLIEKKIDVSELHFAFGVFTRIDIWRYLSLRAGFYKGVISGDDANAFNPERIRRNLNFRSHLFEVNLIGEVNLLRILFPASDQMIIPYVFGGIAIFHFNPRTQYKNGWVTLQPLGTEGQGLIGFPEKYNRTEPAIPYGFGVKVKINHLGSVGIELGWRNTFTDYLDDVSSRYVDRNSLIATNGLLAATLADRTSELINYTDFSNTPGTLRGNPDVLDSYVFVGLSVAINLNKAAKETPQKL